MRSVLILSFVTSNLIGALSEIPIASSSTEDLSKNRSADLAKRNAVLDEFKTLDEDINTVKKLKIMVQLFERIKRENPVAYDRMVRFFEENEKAHRIRRELRLLGRKKVEALEQKLDSSIKYHPKSGRELIHMFVRGLSELYPDMTKLLLKELEGAMDDKNMRKTTVPRQASVKKADKKTAGAEDPKAKSVKGGESTEASLSTENTSSQCPESTICCLSTCSSTCTTSNDTRNQCENNCKPSSARMEGKEEGILEAGDMRIHPTARMCKKTELIPKTKSKNPLNENLTLTAPFKDFQVQGSIMFSNPKKPIKKLTPGERAKENSTVQEPNVDKAQIAETWRDWYPRSDSANVVQPIEWNGLTEEVHAQDHQPYKSPYPSHRKTGASARNYIENEVNFVGHSNPVRSRIALQRPFDQSSEPSVSEFSRPRNKKRSMYVLYE